MRRYNGGGRVGWGADKRGPDRWARSTGSNRYDLTWKLLLAPFDSGDVVGIVAWRRGGM